MNYVEYQCRCPDLDNDWEVEPHYDAGYAAECYARGLCEDDTELYECFEDGMDVEVAHGGRVVTYRVTVMMEPTFNAECVGG